MKKLTLLLMIFCLSLSPAFAVCDYSPFCPPAAPHLTSKMGQSISKSIGATFLSEMVAEKKIKKDLQKITGANFNVAVKSYSFQDFVHGRFKSIVITGKNLDIHGTYLTYLELKTLCNFNYVQINKNPIRFKENMIVSFKTTISDSDLMKTMESNGYLDRLNCVDVKGCGITFFKLSGADVNIKENKLYFTIRVTSQLLLAKPLDIIMTTDLKVEDGRIVLTKVNMENLPKGIDLSKVAYHLNAMNPLTFTLNVLENKNTKMCIKSVNIVGDKITVDGNIFIPKNTK